MIASEYAPLARRTLKVLPTVQQHAIHMGMGVVGEFGELIDAAKKVAIYGKPVDQINRVEEVGDCFWYLFNYCEDFAVHALGVQTALDAGYQDGRAQLANLPAEPAERALVIGEALLGLSLAANSAVCQLLTAKPGSSVAMQGVLGIGNVMGMVCALLDVDPSDAMERNIAKLAARYGDKYSDVAALNRDLGVERKVLEGGGLPGVYEAGQRPNE